MNVLVIHRTNPILTTVFKAKGFSVDTKLNLSREQIIRIIPNYDILIVRSALKVDKEIIDAAINIKFIGRLGAGLENIDVEYAAAKGITVVNSPEGNRAAVGEHSVGMLLALTNKLIIADKEVRRGLWQREENRGEEIEGKTIAIIGYGNMGGAFARKISGFGAKLIAYDKYKTNFSDEFVKEVTLNDVFEQADIVSLHTPLQKDTYHMVNSKFIMSFRKKVILINTSRGAVINTSQLVDALKNNQLKGACLDVLEFEGLSFDNIDDTENSQSFNYLIHANNVVLSPHIAGWTIESEIKLAKVLALKITSAIFS